LLVAYNLTAVMAHHGRADDYYNGTDQGAYQQYQAPQGPPPAQRMQYGQQQQYGMQEQKYSQAPPTYRQNFNLPQDSKQDFQQTFKVDKPKYHDLWAGILVR
jgi:hypothetical protein